MYAALWRFLPGPWWVRLVLIVLLVAAVLFALATWVFPFVDSFVSPQQDVVVE